MKFDSMDIIKAMQIIAESNNATLRLDKTIVAQIVSVENIETGEYRVAYEGNTFLAYSYDVKVSFAVDDNVYVKIPENDMSNRKIIEGRITSSGNTLTNIVEQQVEINTIEPSLDKLYKYEANKAYGIIAGVGSDNPYFMRTIFQNEGSTIEDSIFQSYTANYGKIKISGSFYTKFVGTHHKGNYGLIVTFRTLKINDNGNEEQGTISYRLDFSNFVGNPYRYTSPSPQSIIIDVFKDSIIGLDSVLLFQENFETDKSLNYDNQVIYENRGEDEPPIYNIFVQDINISFCEVIDLKDTSYYLTIATPQGIVFNGDTTSLTLDAKLKYKGENILSKSSCKTYWYKEDLSVKKGDERYDKIAGVRWENINPADIDFLTRITVNSDDVKTHTRYKLVVIYQDVTLSKEIEIKQLNASHDLTINQITKNNSQIVLKVVSNIENDNRDYIGDWYFSLPDGSYDLIPDGQKKSEVDITDYLIYPTATFYCQTYYKDEPLSIEAHSFAISDSQDDLSVIYVGEDIFQYDTNGDVAYEDTEIDRTLGIKIEWKEGFGSAYMISYLAPDGKELANNRVKAHTAENSMMENLWVDSTNVLHYNIKQKYNINYNNNVITVKIKCVTNGNEYLFRKEILFLKDGDQGTNGTTYICAIRPVDLTNGDKLNGFHALEYNNGWQGKGLDLRCYVYKNGVLLNNSPDFDLDFTWKCGSKNTDKTDKLEINSIPGFTSSPDYKRIQGIGSLDTKGDYIIKMILAIREKSNYERTEVYCQYPVDIAVGGLEMNLLDMNLPSYVKYTTSGINATFFNQEVKCLYDENPLPIYSTDETLLQIKNSKLNPIQKFQYSGGIAALRCEVSESMYLLHPIMMYLDTYGNEAINGWDGTKLEIDDDGNYILAPQIGAGKKNSDNTFTGVVMGQDTAEDKIGLYGYRRGIAQFGLKEDGTAFIGASGSGQILFDGNKGTIVSGNYSENSGMKIDLEDGYIDSYNFRLSSSSIDLDSAKNRFTFKIDQDNSSSYFRIISTIDEGSKTLFNASTNNYYLQSLDYESGNSGMCITLDKGMINAYNFNLQSSCLTINAENNRFMFDVAAGEKNGAFIIKADNITLMNVSSNSYYLQSANYNNDELKKLEGVYIDLQRGKFRVGGNAEFNGTINAINGSIGGWHLSEQGLSSGNIHIYNNGQIDLGRNFSISPSGIVNINGIITAQQGQIGGWYIGSDTLKGKGTILSSTTGITTKKITIQDYEFKITQDEYGNDIDLELIPGKHLGDIGKIQGSTGSGEATDCIGINSSAYSVVLQSEENCAIKSDKTIYIEAKHDTSIQSKNRTDIYGESGIKLSGGSLTVDIPKEYQTGIYARFA